MTLIIAYLMLLDVLLAIYTLVLAIAIIWADTQDESAQSDLQTAIDRREVSISTGTAAGFHL